MRINYLRAFGVIVLVASMSIGVSAQKQMFNVGDKDLSVGIGFGSPLVTSGYVGVVPPIAASLDIGLRDDWGPGVFGVGGYVGSSFYRSRYYDINGDKYGYNYTTFIIASRATYHYTFVDKLDTYGGAILGLRITADSKYGSWPAGVNPSNDGGVGPVGSIFVGAKYYFTDTFSAYSELGAGIAYFTVGATFKF